MLAFCKNESVCNYLEDCVDFLTFQYTIIWRLTGLDLVNRWCKVYV